MNAILPIASYNTGVGFPIRFAYRPKATPFAGEACETNHSLVGTESCWKEPQGRLAQQFCHTVRSHLTSFNMVSMCFGALHGRPPSNGANCQCQASHE